LKRLDKGRDVSEREQEAVVLMLSSEPEQVLFTSFSPFAFADRELSGAPFFLKTAKELGGEGEEVEGSE
jgi:hypothetical protein